MQELLCRIGAKHSSPTNTTLAQFSSQTLDCILWKCHCEMLSQNPARHFGICSSAFNWKTIKDVGRHRKACFKDGCFMCAGSPYCPSFRLFTLHLDAVQNIFVGNHEGSVEEPNGKNGDFQSPLSVGAALFNYSIRFLSLKSIFCSLDRFCAISSFRHNLDDNPNLGYVSLGMPSKDHLMLLSHGYK